MTSNESMGEAATTESNGGNIPAHIVTVSDHNRTDDDDDDECHDDDDDERDHDANDEQACDIETGNPSPFDRASSSSSSLDSIRNQLHCRSQTVLSGRDRPPPPRPPVPTSLRQGNRHTSENTKYDRQTSTENVSRCSSVGWADRDDVYHFESERTHEERPTPVPRRGRRPDLVRERSLSQRLSATVDQQVHFHFSALFGDDYSRREGAFVLLAGIVMAFNMGFVNGSTLSGLLTGGRRQVVAGFAGPFGNSSIAVAEHEWQIFRFHSSLILSYMAGAWISGIFTPNPRAYTIQPTYGPTFLVGGIMLFMASVLAALETDPSYVFYLTSAANGLQNGCASLYSSNLIRCSMTGAITDISLAIGQVMRGNYRTLPKAVVLSLMVFFFWVGGITSFYMTRKYLSSTLFFNAALFWVLGAVSVVFLVKNTSISACDAILGTWQWKKTLRQIGDGASVAGSVGDPVTGEERLKQMFDDIDDDGNGEIDHDELLNYLMQMDRRTTARAVKMLIRSADQDQNGTIDRREWEKMVQKLYG